MNRLIVVVFFLCAPVMPFAQSASDTGRVSGLLKDPSGAVIQGGVIEVKNIESGFNRSAVTDGSGHYALDALPVGHYRVSAAAVGFETFFRNDVIVGAKQDINVDFSLGLHRKEASVLVIASMASVGSETVVPKSGNTSDTALLLAGIPGLSLYGNGGVSSLPVIHGMADDKVRTVVDGMDLISACANHMNPPLSYIDPTNVGRIKVFAGIAPASAGGDSIGGTVLVDSGEPEFAAPGRRFLVRGQAATFYRSNGNAYGANLGFTIAGENLSMAYSGSISHSDNYDAAKPFKAAGLAAIDRGWLAGETVGSSRYESQIHQFDFALRRQNHQVELKLGLQHIPYQGFPNQRMDMTLNDSINANLHYRGQYHWGALEARIYTDLTRHKMDFGPDKQYFYGSAATILAPGMPMDTKGLNLGATVKADIRMAGRDTLRVGLETQRYHLNDWWPPSPPVLPPGYTSGGMAPNTFININDGRRDRIGLFAEWDAHWSPRWISSLGVRNDTVLMNTGTVQGYNNTMMYNGAPLYPATTFNSSDRKRTDPNFDLTATGRYTPGETLELETGYARKTHSPNLYERYAWSTNTMAMEMINFAGDGNFYTGNLGLKPEVAHTLSATANWHAPAREQREISVTPYLTYVHDYIDARRCPATVCGSSAAVAASLTATRGFVYLQFLNQSARLYGVDVSGRSVLARAGRYGSLNGTGVLNFVRGENRTTGDNLYHIMPLNAKLALVHRLGAWTNVVEEQLVGAKKEVSQVRNEVRTGGYGLLNLRSSYEWKRFRFDVGLENVLNKFYAAPLSGAYVGQGPTMSGSAIPWGLTIPGMGRSLYSGLALKF